MKMAKANLYYIKDVNYAIDTKKFYIEILEPVPVFNKKYHAGKKELVSHKDIIKKEVDAKIIKMSPRGYRWVDTNKIITEDELDDISSGLSVIMEFRLGKPLIIGFLHPQRGRAGFRPYETKDEE